MTAAASVTAAATLSAAATTTATAMTAVPTASMTATTDECIQPQIVCSKSSQSKFQEYTSQVFMPNHEQKGKFKHMSLPMLNIYIYITFLVIHKLPTGTSYIHSKCAIFVLPCWFKHCISHIIKYKSTRLYKQNKNLFIICLKTYASKCIILMGNGFKTPWHIISKYVRNLPIR